MRDTAYDLVAGLDFDLAPWQQVLALLLVAAIVVTVVRLVGARDRRRQRQLDEAIRRRWSVLR